MAVILCVIIIHAVLLAVCSLNALGASVCSAVCGVLRLRRQPVVWLSRIRRRRSAGRGGVIVGRGASSAVSSPPVWLGLFPTLHCEPSGCTQVSVSVPTSDVSRKQ